MHDAPSHFTGSFHGAKSMLCVFAVRLATIQASVNQATSGRADREHAVKFFDSMLGRWRGALGTCPQLPRCAW